MMPGEDEAPHGPHTRPQPEGRGTVASCHAAMRLPRRYAPFVYGTIQAALTTAVATAIAVRQVAGDGASLLLPWLYAWVLAFVSILPVVVLAAPLIQRAVLALTQARTGED